MIRYANENDLGTLKSYDIHIREDELCDVIKRKRVFLMQSGNVILGWLRYNLFWDNTPFMNMLFILEGHRGKGYGKQLVNHWEDAMRRCNYHMVMTSTLSSEQAQFFYRKIGYVDCGAFVLPGEPLEVILRKDL